MNNYEEILSQIRKETQLIVVSKTRSDQQIMSIYNQGQRKFGENRVPELQEKQLHLPSDIEWHMIGHLQRNKVKYIAPFVHLIHSVDSLRLANEINKQAAKNNRTINILLQLKIGQEEAKYGFSFSELDQILSQNKLQDLANINICGVMGMASFVVDKIQIRAEFNQLRSFFDKIKTDYFPDNIKFKEVSMGMSGDYKMAISCGSTMVRIGSLIFKSV